MSMEFLSNSQYGHVKMETPYWIFLVLQEE